MCEPEQEASESLRCTAPERQFLSPTGNRMLVPGPQAGCQHSVTCLHNSCRQGTAFTVIVATGDIAGYAKCQKLCETIQALSALSQ